MAANHMLFLALIFCFVHRSASLTSDFSVSPEKLTLAHNMSTVGGLVTLTCEATNLPVSGNLNSISVRRSVEVNGNVEDQTLATLAMVNGAETMIVPNPLPGVTPTGSFATKKVTITMEQTKCADAGNYTCGVAGLDYTSGVPLSDTSVKVLDIEVSPGPIELTPDPSGEDVWTVYQILEMRCNGPVGTVVAGQTKIEWKWETRVKLGEQQFSSWMAYDGDPSDIAPPESAPGDCFETQTSILKRNLTTRDTNREYRCYITRNGVSYTQFADTHFVGTVSDEPITTTPANNGGGSSGPSKSDAGTIVGIVVGVLVVIIVVIVVVVVIVRRRKAKQEDDYEPDEPRNKPDDRSHPNPYVSEPPPVSYSQPNRFRNDRETWEDRERETGARANEGLHYAELEIVRGGSAPPSDSTESVPPRAATPTEYASIRLY
ncbi:uncharacterized protein LOC143291570 isoform X2 [Babylonia areolata]|uniref:uncharacterized protein LOC143291570 isoform X2 n=1 Tax=Babylonia areolata TaxID=304850 RepID=UPI003FCF0303